MRGATAGGGLATGIDIEACFADAGTTCVGRILTFAATGETVRAVCPFSSLAPKRFIRFRWKEQVETTQHITQTVTIEKRTGTK